MIDPSGDEAEYFSFRPSLIDRLSSWYGAAAGWCAWAFAKAGRFEMSERLADFAIERCRHGRGAIRAIGLKTGWEGRRAGYRGILMISGIVHDRGVFANNGFFATYHVAAFNEERAFLLASRFEKDAVPSSLKVESWEAGIPDPGAEGVLWIARARTFFPPACP